MVDDAVADLDDPLRPAGDLVVVGDHDHGQALTVQARR